MRRPTECLLCWFCLTVCSTAQPAPAAATPEAPPAKASTDSGPLLRLSRQMDTNGDLQVDEKEFAAGFAKVEKDAAKVHRDLLTWLDQDKNGVLSPDELRPFEAAVLLLPLIRSVDQNGDAALQEPELDAAFTDMAAFCQGANERLLGEFDLNRDSTLNEDELQLARQGLQSAAARGPRPAKAPAGRAKRAAARDGATAGGAQP